MTAVVFLGPSLLVADARRRLDARYLPPAAQGDIWRAVEFLRPTVIGLVDGVFRDQPAVWHKEILYALEQGVHVIGSSSMGALRAAELADFGMRGVGLVFESYRRGYLFDPAEGPFEDDDEVAIVHAPAALGWQPLTEAMIDIRCSLRVAELSGIVSPEERSLAVGSAKRLHYADRTWTAVLAAARADGLSASTATGLSHWLVGNMVRQKRDDALSLLDAIKAMVGQVVAPFRASFALARTEAWQAAIGAAARHALPAAEDASGDATPAGVLEELRLDPFLWQRISREALLDLLVGAQDDAPPVDGAWSLALLRQRLGLATRRAVDAWHEQNDAVPGLLGELAAAEGRIAGLVEASMPQLAARMLDRLRLEQRYGDLRDRAATKRRVLAERADAVADAPGEELALRWFFEDRLELEVPEDVDSAARRQGFVDAAALVSAACRELLFRRLTQAGGEG